MQISGNGKPDFLIKVIEKKRKEKKINEKRRK
jgi:hypothetical protein